MKNRKTVVIVSWFGESETGGVESVTYYLHQIWGKEYNIKIIDFNKVREWKIASGLIGKHYALDAILVSIYTSNYIKRFKKKYGVGKIIVVTQGYNAPFVKADLSFAHGNMRGFTINALKKNKWDFYQLFEKYAWNHAKKIVAVGAHVKKEAQKYYGVDFEKINIIENCIDTSMFYPIGKGECKDFNIIFCGRLSPEKNPEKLLNFAKYIENKENVKLIIATPSKESTSLFNGLKNTDIRIGLKKHEMNEFYNIGDIMYFPSRYEGFGLVTCECLSAGVPVFGNMVGAIGDFYNSGREGIGIITGNNEKDYISMLKLSEKYRSMENRQLLHEQVVKYNNFELYKEKIMLAIKDVDKND